MAENYYEVGGRTFRNQADYNKALRDKQIIDELREKTDFNNQKQLLALYKRLKAGDVRFFTLLGQDFCDELEDCIRNKKPEVAKNSTGGKPASSGPAMRTVGKRVSPELEQEARRVLQKRERNRRRICIASASVAFLCLGYFGLYSFQLHKLQKMNQEMTQLKELPQILVAGEPQTDPLYTLDEPGEQKEVLDEYKNLLIKNKKLIGWVKIDDTYIDYPVVQTSDNEYYLDHNIYQEYDKNGSIFLDKDCDIVKPSTNLIIYGHHMKSGAMFGTLNKYEDKEYFEKHRYIQFDTIYEKGTYEVMYVFRSRVYREDEILFKYYQFIDASGEQEFLSNMKEMEALSLYDTGVTARYGDCLLTLSTCDYQEKNGRFVVVAKKIKE